MPQQAVSSKYHFFYFHRYRFLEAQRPFDLDQWDSLLSLSSVVRCSVSHEASLHSSRRVVDLFDGPRSVSAARYVWPCQRELEHYRRCGRALARRLPGTVRNLHVDRKHRRRAESALVVCGFPAAVGNRLDPARLTLIFSIVVSCHHCVYGMGRPGHSTGPIVAAARYSGDRGCPRGAETLDECGYQ